MGGDRWHISVICTACTGCNFTLFYDHFLEECEVCGTLSGIVDLLYFLSQFRSNAHAMYSYRSRVEQNKGKLIGGSRIEWRSIEIAVAVAREVAGHDRAAATPTPTPSHPTGQERKSWEASFKLAVNTVFLIIR